jgi:hypothetical protein
VNGGLLDFSFRLPPSFLSVFVIQYRIWPCGDTVAELENIAPGCLPVPKQRKHIFFRVRKWWKIAVLPRKKFLPDTQCNPLAPCRSQCGDVWLDATGTFSLGRF